MSDKKYNISHMWLKYHMYINTIYKLNYIILNRGMYKMHTNHYLCTNLCGKIHVIIDSILLHQFTLQFHRLSVGICNQHEIIV